MLQSYVDSVKDIEGQEKRLEKLKAQIDSKSKQIDEKKTKIASEEEFLRKEQNEWKNNSTRRTEELDGALRIKQAIQAKIEQDLKTKTADLASKLSEAEKAK